MLGLGLGLHKSTMLLSNLKLFTRNSDWGFWIDKATGTSKGTNSPQVNPIADLVGVVGKNKFNGFVENFGYNIVTGLKDTNANRIRNTIEFIEINPNADYSLRSLNYDGTQFWKLFYDSNKTYLGIYANDAIFTTPVNAKYMNFYCVGAGVTVAEPQIMLNEGTTTTAYEPYGKVNGLLQGFGFTPASGYVDVVAPNGKTVTGVQGDGVNDVIVIPNNPSIDITGTGDFAIGVVFKTGATIPAQTIFAKTDGGAGSNIQYVLGITSNYLYFYLNSTFISFPLATLNTSTMYKFLVYRVGSVLKCKLLNEEKYNVANDISIVTKPNFRIGAIATDVGGTTHTNFSNLWFGTIKIVNGAITPFTEADLIKDWDSFCSKVYGL